MADLDLTQVEADALIAMEKVRANDDAVKLPVLGGRVSVPLISRNMREEFLLDISRGRIDLRKGTLQTRARHVIVLVRLDFGGPPHRNPDGNEIGSPHLHLYREGCGDKWADLLPPEHFSDIKDRQRTLEEFLAYCKVMEPPDFEENMFG